MIPIVSIILAFGLPVYALWRSGRPRPLKRPYFFAAGSFLFCGAAMLAELYTVKRRAFAGDYGGIEDTIGAVLLLCGVLLGFTLVLNLLLLILTYERDDGTEQKG